MIDTTNKEPHTFGNLLWEYTPTASEISFWKRILFYIGLAGCICLMVIWFLPASDNNPEKAKFIGLSVYGALWVLAMFIPLYMLRRQQHYQIHFYETGVQTSQSGTVRSASYADLEILERLVQARGYGMTQLVANYCIQFPDHSHLRTQNQQVGQFFQDSIVRIQLPLTLQMYEQGKVITFGPIQMNQQGISIAPEAMIQLSDRSFSRTDQTGSLRSPYFSWNKIKYFGIELGRLIVYGEPKSPSAKLKVLKRVTLSSIPNLQVFLNLLNQLNLLQT